jgi:hypothetical protein
VKAGVITIAFTAAACPTPRPTVWRPSLGAAFSILAVLAGCAQTPEPSARLPNLRVSRPITSAETAVEAGAECNVSDGVRSLLAGANPDGLFDRYDKDLTVPDLVRAR